MRYGALRPRILLADDNDLILEKVTEVLKHDFDVVAKVRNGHDVVLAAWQVKPDVVLLDIVMPGMDGIRAARALRLIGCDSKIIFLSGIEDPQIVEAALATTANGFVFKSRVVSDLSRAIADVLSGQVFVSGKESMPPASAKSGETNGGVARLWRFN